MGRPYDIAVPPGAGIGPEVITEGLFASFRTGVVLRDEVAVDSLVITDVLVTETQFGDILSDLAAATVSGMEMAPSADIGDDHAVFQPAHGTAPAIAGLGLATPMATLLSAAMMCDWLGTRRNDRPLIEAGRWIEAAVEAVLAEGRVRTPDIGETSKTDEVGRAVADWIR